MAKRRRAFLSAERVLLTLLLLSFTTELFGRVADGLSDALRDGISVVSILTICVSAILLVHLSCRNIRITFVMVVASCAAMLSTAMRIFDRIDFLVNAPFIGSSSPYYRSLLTAADLLPVLGAFVAFFLVIFQLARTREELLVKSQRLEHEIDERKIAEHENERLEAQFYQAQKLESIGLLAGGIAHDFNNVLTGILGSTSLLLNDLPDDAPAHGRIQFIEKGAKHASDLTRQLLTYAGKAKIKKGAHNISEIATDMVDLLKVSVPKSAELVLEMDEALPKVDCDITQLRQVILNLLTNAAEAVGREHGTVRVRTGSAYCSAADFEGGLIQDPLPAGDYVFLEVSDTGEGMDEADVNKIFDPFFTTKIEGRGLGLSTVLGIVRGHSGNLKVETVKGEGTTFTAFFPLCDMPEEASANGNGHALPDGEPQVLVIEDEEIVRNVTRDFLVRAGFSVILAEDGEEGVAIFREQRRRISHVLLDLKMAGMGGMEALREMLEVAPEARIIVTSGMPQREAERLLAEFEVLAYLKKPYPPGELLRLLAAEVAAPVAR